MIIQQLTHKKSKLTHLLHSATFFLLPDQNATSRQPFKASPFQLCSLTDSFRLIGNMLAIGLQIRQRLFANLWQSENDWSPSKSDCDLWEKNHSNHQTATDSFSSSSFFSLFLLDVTEPLACAELAGSFVKLNVSKCVPALIQYCHTKFCDIMLNLNFFPLIPNFYAVII